MSPTASVIAVYGYLGTYPRNMEQCYVPGQRCPATWLTLHMRRTAAKICSFRLTERPVTCLLSMGADDPGSNSNSLKHQLNTHGQPTLRNLLVDIGDTAIPTAL